MKRLTAWTLCALLLTGLLAGCRAAGQDGGESRGSQPSASLEPNTASRESAPQADVLKTGLAVITSAADSTSAAGEEGLADIGSTAVALLVDGDGRIAACAIDAVQSRIPFTADGALALNAGTVFPSKRELGKDYGLAEASGIGREWYEQTAAFASYVTGKTVAEVKGMALDERTAPTEAELSSSVTIAVGGFIDDIEKAARNAQALGAREGDSLGLGIATNMRNSKGAGESEGTAQADSTYAAVSFAPDGTITSCVLDGSQGAVRFDGSGAITSDLNGPFRTKNELGDSYGMREASGIGKEWYEQAAAYARYAAGRTVGELEELSVTEKGAPAGGELASSVTISVGPFNEALRKAVEEHNEVCRILTEIGEMRKMENPPITGYEYHVLNLVSYTCPKAFILPYLRETLAEIKKRKVDAKPWYRARVSIVGSEIDDPMLTKLIENCGAFVVSDRYCFGSTPGREVIELNDTDDVLTQLCLHYMQHSECARYISDEKVQQRRDTADRLAREFGAEGIIYEQMKYCDYWGFERALVSHIMAEEKNWPVLSVDRLYNNGNSGQLRTRVQAFVESLEIKRIRKEGGEN